MAKTPCPVEPQFGITSRQIRIQLTPVHVEYKGQTDIVEVVVEDP